MDLILQVMVESKEMHFQCDVRKIVGVYGKLERN